MRIQVKDHNRLKVLLAMAFAVVFGAMGDILLSKGMKDIDQSTHSGAISVLIAVATNPHVLAGIGMLIVFMVLYLVSLSWEDMSYVLPLTGAIYILVTIFAFFLLRETVSPLRWGGALLVASGIVVVART